MSKTAPQERETRNQEGLKKVQRPVMRAPRPWEPIPLHAPVPQPHSEDRRGKQDDRRIVEDISAPRGCVIIDYGNGE